MFAVAIFLGSFLLFLVQPLVARLLLPHHGGSAVVWTTCMLFFQALLLGGYWYADRLTSRFDGRRQLLVHVAVLLAGLAFLPLATDGWEAGALGPTSSITLSLAGAIGVPYLALAASSPLLQHWLGRATGETPYRMFAVSNAGSLVGLLSYPFLVEPLLSLAGQTRAWSVGFLLYVLLVVAVALQVRGRLLSPPARRDAPAGPIFPGDRLLWISLAACGSLVLLSTTSQMTRDVAVVPFLWVLPLGLYLLTFVICFDHARWYRREVWTPAYVVGLAGVVWLYWRAGAEFPLGLVTQIAIYAGALFTCCMVCHGELARHKPHPARLTDFYLMVAVGGAVGGVLATLVAPRIFVDAWEFPVALIATRVLLAVSVDRGSRRPLLQSLRPLLVAAALGAVVVYLSVGTSDRRGELVDARRNFYGILRVYDQEVGTRESVVSRSLYHGSTVHGSQFTREDLRSLPTTYYGVTSGIGVAIDRVRALRAAEGDGALQVGGVGLGAGTIAAHGAPGDRFRFYEIDPDVARIADESFFFLAESQATVETVVGDARASLEAELERAGPRRFDLLAIDAFSGDAIPVHLLTREAVELYWRHLRPDGALAVHVSNRHLNLQPVLRRVADELGYEVALLTNPEDTPGTFAAEWVVMTRDSALHDELDPLAAPWTAPPAARLWTDDYSSLLGLLR